MFVQLFSKLVSRIHIEYIHDVHFKRVSDVTGRCFDSALSVSLFLIRNNELKAIERHDLYNSLYLFFLLLNAFTSYF